MNQVKQTLIDHMQGLEIIDSHEHLHPESMRLDRQVDVLTLVSLYAWYDIMSAGLPTDDISTAIGANYLLDTSVPLEERWDRVSPYLQQIKHGSYYRPTAIALKDIYGIDDLNESTYRRASELIASVNTKGLYRQILRDRCGIKTCLVQNGRIQDQDPPELFTPLFSWLLTYRFENTTFIESLGKYNGVQITDLDTYFELFRKHLEDARKKGAVGYKISANKHVEPDMDAARTAFKALLKGEPAAPVLQSTTLDFVLRLAAEWDWPVAVHCGIWHDYRTVDPKNIIDTVIKHPKVRFDLYHLGMPFVRDCIFIAKNFPNAYLNLCWCYAISQEMTRRAINEILDTVPINKIFGFGADYIWAVENVYGHLVMARETIAEALSERIAGGRLNIDCAKHITNLWLHDNPARFYNLDHTGDNQ